MSEIEFGLDAKLWDNRIGLNASVFQRTTKDLITLRDLPPSEGFGLQYINAGELENQGIELGLTADIFRNPDGFNWNVGVNFYADDPVITKLACSLYIVHLLVWSLGSASPKACCSKRPRNFSA